MFPTDVTENMLMLYCTKKFGYLWLSLAILALNVSACSESQFEDIANKRGSDPLTENTKDSESVDAPGNITGAYLFCEILESTDTMAGVPVGCRIEKDGEKIPNPDLLGGSFSSNFDTTGSQVQITELPITTESPWHRMYALSAAPMGTTTNVRFEFAVQISGQSIKFNFTLDVTWDDGCSSPTLDFESLLGQRPTKGSVINGQYLVSHGLSLSTLSGAPLMIAEYGVDTPNAYYGGPENIPNYQAPDQMGGKFFITDGQRTAAHSETLILSYSAPTNVTKVVVMDIDFLETVTVKGLNTEGTVIAEISATAPDNVFRDGERTPLIIRSADDTKSIVSIHITSFPSGGGTVAGNIGLAIDNISPYCGL